jgi:hypothetical protein
MGKRECGTCSACCTSLGVPEIHKSAGQKCQQVKPGGGGCEIYSRRPKACRDYECLWRSGSFAEIERPDQLGVSLDKTDGYRPDMFPGEGWAYIAREAVPGGFELARGFLTKLTETFVVVLIVEAAGKRVVLGPPAKVAKVNDAIQWYQAQQRRFLPVQK